MIECTECGAFFEPTTGKNRYCSSSCYRKQFYRKRKLEGYKYDHIHSYAMRRYGISGELYKSLKQLFELNGCAICGGRDGFNLDHCHSTGQLRGLLCKHCNKGLGHFFDNVDSLENAITYLSKFKEGHLPQT